jgi:hypothetical protein
LETGNQEAEPCPASLTSVLSSRPGTQKPQEVNEGMNESPTEEQSKRDEGEHNKRSFDQGDE